MGVYDLLHSFAQRIDCNKTCKLKNDLKQEISDQVLFKPEAIYIVVKCLSSIEWKKRKPTFSTKFS